MLMICCTYVVDRQRGNMRDLIRSRLELRRCIKLLMIILIYPELRSVRLHHCLLVLVQFQYSRIYQKLPNSTVNTISIEITNYRKAHNENCLTIC